MNLATTRESVLSHAVAVNDKLRLVVEKMMAQGLEDSQSSRDRSRIVLAVVKYLEYLRNFEKSLPLELTETNEDDLMALPAEELMAMCRHVLGFAAKRLGEGAVRELVS